MTLITLLIAGVGVVYTYLRNKSSNAGDGSSGYANRNLIGIEIARSMDYSGDKYDRA